MGKTSDALAELNALVARRKTGRYRTKDGRVVNIVDFEDASEQKPDLSFPKKMKAKVAFGKYMVGDEVKVIDAETKNNKVMYKTSNGALVNPDFLMADGFPTSQYDITYLASGQTTYGITDSGERVDTRDFDSFVGELTTGISKYKYYIIGGVAAAAIGIAAYFYMNKSKR